MNLMQFSSEAKSIIKLLPKTLISVKVFLWLYPISVGLSLLLAPDNFSNFKNSLLWIFVGFAAHSAMLPFVIYGKNQGRLPEQIFLVLAMGATRGAIFVLLPPILNLEDSLSAFARITNSTVAVFYWFQAGSIIVQYGSTFRSRIKDIIKELLEKKIVDMPTAAKSSSNQLIAVIGHLQAKIIETVGSAPSKEDIVRASNDIDKLISEHIRPLSKSSWKDGELTWIRAGFLSVIRRTLTTERIPVTGVILLTLPFSFLTQSSRVGVFTTLVVLTIWISITIFADRIIYKDFRDTDYLKVNLQFLGSLVFFTYPVTFFFQLVLPISRDLSLALMIFGYLLSMVIQLTLFAVSTLLVALYDDQEFAFEFLRDLIRRGELEEFLIKTKEGGGQEYFAQYVHAEVQSQLLACKLLLLKAAESDFDLFPPEITAQIIDRMEKIKQPYQRLASRVPVQRIEELSKSWAGLAEISHDLPPQLSQVTPNSDVISQLIEEAVVNSIRHGGARKISVSAKTLPAGIEVTISDNGNMPPAPEVTSGLGSILFDTFTKNWSRVREGNTTVVTFLVEDLLDR
jgi:hypothetical protein